MHLVLALKSLQQELTAIEGKQRLSVVRQCPGSVLSRAWHGGPVCCALRALPEAFALTDRWTRWACSHAIS